MNEYALIFNCQEEKSKTMIFPKTTKIKDALIKFLKETNSIIDLSPAKRMFIFHNIILNKSEYLEKSLFQVFKGGAVNFRINVKDTEGIIGGCDDFFPIDFCDVNRKRTEGHKLTKTKKGSYRITKKGINIYGICKGNNCIAKDKEVIVPIKKKNFDLINEKYNLICPICSNIIIPKTVGFRDCEYKIQGKKYQNNKIEDFCFTGRADNPGEIKYYNPSDNGTALMIQLIFEVLKYF